MNDKYVNGRRVLLQALDSLLAEEGNIKLFKTAFQTRMDEDTMGFFKEIVMPLMPKEALGMAPDEDKKDHLIKIEFVPADKETNVDNRTETG